MSVAVVVEEGTSCAPAIGGFRQASRTGYIRERSITVIAVEDILAPVGDEQIVKAVIVVVAHANTTGPAGLHQSRTLGYIGESSIAVVLIEAIARSRGSAGEAGAGQQKDVDPSVVVEV